MREFRNIKKLLINVDMVKGFVETGAMSDSYIKHIIPEQIRLMEKVKNSGGEIAFVKDTHKENCEEFTKFPPHCIENTEESELTDELKSFENDSLVYKKNSTSAMFAPDFEKDINEMMNLEEVIIVGCCTDICILNLAIPLQNYFDQKDRKVKITVPKNAVETYNSPAHNRDEYNVMAFKLMKQAGINVE